MEASRNVLRALARRFRVGLVAFGVMFPFYLVSLFGSGSGTSFGSGVLALVILAGAIQVGVWIVGKRRKKGPKRAARKTAPDRAARAVTHPPKTRAPARWIAPGEPVEVHGYRIAGGMLYVGESLPALAGGVDPALVDPTLDVDTRRLDASNGSLAYWPSYAAISPASRAGYLLWHASGRREPAAPIGFVFLFFYGLERRVLVDLHHDDSIAAELPAIQAELRALLRVYGEASGSFRGYAGNFLDLIEAFLSLRQPLASLVPPPLASRGFDLPLTLRLGLARMAADRLAIPAPWALAWGWHRPDIPLRIPATRVQDVFARLFAVRYREAHGEGILPPKGQRRLVLSYRPATSGIAEVRIPVAGLTDVADLPSPVRKIRALMDRVAGELDPYSRWIKKRPNEEPGLEAIALLPAEIVDESFAVVRRVREWAAPRFGEDDSFVAPGVEIVRLWDDTIGKTLSRPDAVKLAQAFARIGFGLEPDVRFGGPPVSAEGQGVVFRNETGAEGTASAAYTAATTLLHLAAAVSAADGDISEGEIEQMARHIELSLHLSAGERLRLKAHLRWLANTNVRLAGLKKRLDALTEPQRKVIGRAAVLIASADGVIAPGEVTMLQRIHVLLGLDGGSVTSQLHQSLTAPRPVPGEEPVTVLPGRSGEPGYRIPARPGGAGSGLALDDRVIRRTLSETAAVSALLGDIFVDEPEPEVPTVPPNGSQPGTPGPSPVETVHGLDAPHSSLLRMLATRSQISQQDFDDLASTVGVMPGGALDVLNEAALDALDEPVIEPDGDGELIVATGLIQELLS